MQRWLHCHFCEKKLIHGDAPTDLVAYILIQKMILGKEDKTLLQVQSLLALASSSSVYPRCLTMPFLVVRIPEPSAPSLKA